jgi:hypothetical protein
LRGGLTFLGGDGANTFSMSSTRLGGNLTVLGGNNPTGLDMVTIEDGVLVGGLTTVSNGAGQSQVNVVDDTDLMGGLTVNGGPSNDSVQLLSTRLGGQLRVNLGAGSNDVTLSEVFLSGSAFFSGGPGDDVVFLHDIIVGGVTANLGNGNNKFTIDVPTNTVASTIGSRIARNLSVSTGTGMDVVALGSAAPVFLGGSVTIETGNEVGPGDGVSFNDTTCAGGVFIDLGNGNDRLAVEEVNTAAQVCNFAGSFSVLAGGGEDQVLLGILGDTAGKANFERKPRLNGGAGTGDILSPRNYSIGGIFLAPFTPTTFEPGQPDAPRAVMSGRPRRATGPRPGAGAGSGSWPGRPSRPPG